jgi:hypothetical protein
MFTRRHNHHAVSGPTLHLPLVNHSNFTYSTSGVLHTYNTQFYGEHILHTTLSSYNYAASVIWLSILYFSRMEVNYALLYFTYFLLLYSVLYCCPIFMFSNGTLNISYLQETVTFLCSIFCFSTQ